MLEVRELGNSGNRFWLGSVQTPKPSALSSKRLNFILAKVTMTNIPRITFEFLVPCFIPVLSDKHDIGKSSFRTQSNNKKRKPQTAIPNHASKVLFAVNP